MLAEQSDSEGDIPMLTPTDDNKQLPIDPSKSRLRARRTRGIALRRGLVVPFIRSTLSAVAVASVLVVLPAALTSTALASSGQPASTSVDATMAPAALTSDPVVGDWYVTYGNTTVVEITESGGVYTETSTEPVQVTGSSCYLPTGTVISTFKVSGGGYSGEHGLWFTSDCSFDKEAPMTITLEGDTLSGEIVGFERLVFTRALPDVVTSSASPHETTATVYGSVNPSGQSTTYYVAYDTSGSPFCAEGGSAPTFSTPVQPLSA